MRPMSIALAATAVAGITVLAGCGGSSGGTSSSSGTATSSISSATASPTGTAKPWAFDSSGWWVPNDPTGCLQETVTCKMTVWKTRAYKKGNNVPDLIQHGQTINLICKAPTPVPIFNSFNVYSTYWFYSEWKGATYWVPDIYASKTADQAKEMAQGVPDCSSDTPGVNG